MDSSSKRKSLSDFQIVSEEPEPLVHRVQLMYHGNYKITVPETGNTYTWEKSGDILLIVNEVDFGYIITRKQSKSCCGGPEVNLVIFREV